MGGPQHAALNAALNGLAAVLILVGWLSIRRGSTSRHRTLMLSATAVSAIFLVSYLVRFAISGAHRYPGAGIWKAIYFTILISHMALAIATPPLVVRAIFLAWKGRYEEHRRVVRWTFPIWLYVSVTGVVVFFLLYFPPG